MMIVFSPLLFVFKSKTRNCFKILFDPFESIVDSFLFFVVHSVPFVVVIVQKSSSSKRRLSEIRPVLPMNRLQKTERMKTQGSSLDVPPENDRKFVIVSGSDHVSTERTSTRVVLVPDERRKDVRTECRKLPAVFQSCHQSTDDSDRIFDLSSIRNPRILRHIVLPPTPRSMFSHDLLRV